MIDIINTQNKMEKISKKGTLLQRIAIIIASLVLIITLFTPIWHISLDAPQYPEGLGMQIWATDIKGVCEHDLQNINGLNHYIGMKKIEPDSFVELKLMPYIIIGLIVIGLIAAIINKRHITFAWLGIFTIVGIAGLYDFYMWEYDYGHNLDLEHASIKVPGMSFQPPLLGSKQIMNFTATSLPAEGGWALLISFGLGFGAVISQTLTKGQSQTLTNKRHSERSEESTLMRSPGFFTPLRSVQNDNVKTIISKAGNLIILILIPFIFAACSHNPEPINYGKDVCSHCGMTIVEKQFGTELITKTGKIEKFDSIECLAAYLLKGTIASDKVHSIWVMDYKASDVTSDGTGKTSEGTRHFIEAEKASYVYSQSIRSPMGMFLSAYKDESTAKKVLANKPGKVLKWVGVKELVRKEWM